MTSENIQFKHPLWRRWAHWLNFPLLTLMLISGLQINWADSAAFTGWVPESVWHFLSLDHKLSIGMAIHLTLMWFFILNGLLYLGYLVVSGQWRELVPTLQSPGLALKVVLHDLGLGPAPDPNEKFNHAQRIAYSGALALGALAVISGLVVFKPENTYPLSEIFGGYGGARLVHFGVAALLVGFFGVHIAQVGRAGWNQFQSMVTGFTIELQKNTSSQTLGKIRQRQIRSFTVLAVGLTALLAVALLIWQSPVREGLPEPLRQGHEFNQMVWQNLLSHPEGKKPKAPGTKQSRVNGSIGLDEDLDLQDWKLEVRFEGLPAKSAAVTLHLNDLQNMPQVDSTAVFKCVEGWSENISYRGVRFSDFLKALNLGELKKLAEEFPYVGLQTPDGLYYVSIDMESMLHSQTLLAMGINGQELDEDHGAPVRLIIPVKYGIKNLKRIGKIVLAKTRPPDYWNERGYDWYSGL